MSTILKALSRLEDDEASQQQASANPPGRGSWGADPAKKRGFLATLMLVVAGVVFAAALGAGVTLLALQGTSDPAATSLQHVAEIPTSAEASVGVAVVSGLPLNENADPGPETPSTPGAVAVRPQPRDIATDSLEIVGREGLATVPVTVSVATRKSIGSATRDPESPLHASDRAPSQVRLAQRQEAESTATIDAEQVLAERSRKASAARKTETAALPSPWRGEPMAPAGEAATGVVAEVDEALIQTTRPAATPPVAARKTSEIVVARTIWHPVAGRRRAILEIRESGGTREVELRQGERIGSLMISEIRPAGVTAVRNGVEREYRVGGRL